MQKMVINLKRFVVIQLQFLINLQNQHGMSVDFCTMMFDNEPQVGKVLLEIFGEKRIFDKIF